MASDHITTHNAEAQVEAYLAELATRLRGPARRRMQILAELGDGLDQAIADRTGGGVAEDRAIAAAIAEFGTPSVVANAFAGELATAYARRTVALYILTGPLVGICWLLVLQPHPWRTGVLALLAAIPVLPLIIIAVATAAATFATTGRLIRWFPEASPGRALTATIAIAALVLVVDLTVIAIFTQSDAPASALAMLAVSASLTRIVCSLITIRRTSVMRRRVTAASDPVPTAARNHDARR
jgi:MFS family permease